MSFVNRLASAVHSLSGGLSGTTLTVGGVSVTVEEKIADGGYGLIYRATDSRGQNYAVKALQAPDEEHYSEILHEYEIHKKCSDCPNVVSVYGMASNQATRQATILMEFCSDSLISQINAVFNRGFDDRTIVEVFTEVCEAVEFMHTLSPPIIHRDLKPENVLRNNGKWKLCDFGSATTRVYTLKTTKERNEASDDLEKNTTPMYRAPEMCDLFRRQPINTKADVWALGCILFKLCTFRDAFPEGSNLQILNVKYQWPQNKNVNQKFKDIVKYIFNTNPDARPSTRDVLAELYRQFPEWVDSKWKKDSNAPANEPFNPFGNNPSQSEQKFDPFGNQSPQQQNQRQNDFNPFENQQAPAQRNFPQRRQNEQNAFNPFENDSSIQQSVFNPFDNTPSKQPQQTFNPFAQQSHQNQPSPQQQRRQQYQNQLQDDVDDTYDPFASIQQNHSASNDLKPPSGDGGSAPFISFNDKPPSAPSNTFNPFDSNSQPQGNAHANENLFNPFDSNSQIHGNTPSDENLFNPFDSNSQQNGPVHQPPRIGRQNNTNDSSFNPFGQSSNIHVDEDEGESLLDSFDSPKVQRQPGDIAAFSNIRSNNRSQEFDDISMDIPRSGFGSQINPQRVKTDPIGLIKDLIKLNEIDLSSALFTISSSQNDGLFFLKLLHMSGDQGSKIAATLPQIGSNDSPIHAVIESRRYLHSNFPQFEGNFALTCFMRLHKANPVPIGQPPVCTESAKELLDHLSKVISLVRVSPTTIPAEEALLAYQVTAYVLAKLKQFKVNEGYIVNSAIPLFKNQYNQLKRAFSFVKPPMNFPEQPFDFNDNNFLTRIRPPQSKKI